MVQARVFRKPEPLLRMVGQFRDGGIGRTFQYQNHPKGTSVTITRTRLKVTLLRYSSAQDIVH